MSEVRRAESTARDFGFWMGWWHVRNRRRRRWLAGCEEWEEFEATSVARLILGGLGNEDEFRYAGGFVGMSFRFFDPATRKWAIYWASTRRPGVIEPPVFGAFSGDTGTFDGSDTFEGRPIWDRFAWSGITTPAPRREQAFSDGGRMRETSWVMEFTRARGQAGQVPHAG
jgi:hypothetical protein